MLSISSLKFDLFLRHTVSYDLNDLISNIKEIIAERSLLKENLKAI
jgi:hypothetical protein